MRTHEEFCESITVKKCATIASNHNLSSMPLTDYQLDRKLNKKLKHAKEHPNTVFLKAPNGEIYHFEDCEILKEFDDDFYDPEVFFNTQNQDKLAKELFDSTGILVADMEGGDN